LEATAFRPLHFGAGQTGNRGFGHKDHKDHRAAQPQPKSGKLFNREWTPMNANESPSDFLSEQQAHRQAGHALPDPRLLAGMGGSDLLFKTT
jgi:hypothetical protein